MADLSVIIPVYNVETYLKQCLDSIVNQTLENIEIICVNDGSTDNSLAILEKYAKKDSRIKIITQENQGLGPARNTGIKYASSDYISFIDSDDFISRNTFKDSLNKMRKNNCDLLIYNTKIYKKGCDEQNIHALNFKDNLVIEDIIEYPELFFSTSAWNKIFNKNLFSFLSFPARLYEDNIVTIEVLLNSKKIFLNKDATYFYRKNKESITANISKTNAIALSNVIADLIDLSKKYPDYKENILFLALKFLNDIIFWMFYYDWYIEEECEIFSLIKSFSSEFSNDLMIKYSKIFSNELLYDKEILNLNKYDCGTFLAKYKYFQYLPYLNTVANLYIDYGEGFNENDKLSIKYNFNELNKVKFDLKSLKNIKSLRFDPIEKAFTKVKIISISSNNDIKIIGGNFDNSLDDEYQIFTNLDPSYILGGDFSNLESLEFKFNLKILNNNDLSLIFTRKNNEINNLKDKLNNKKSFFPWKKH